MKLIAGLGNPGSQYELSRHNAGFLILELLAEKYATTFQKSTKFNADVAKASIQGHQCLLLKPSTYMNLSGTSIRQAMAFYKLSIEHVIVIYDDIDLSAGTVKTRLNGSHGGHNGIRHIIQELGSNNFSRIKLGVGRPTQEQAAISSWVLARFSEEELANLEQKMFPAVLSRLNDLLT